MALWVAERFVRTVRSECLDWLLIVNQQHLEHVLALFVAHYNGHRPHRVLGLKRRVHHTPGSYGLRRRARFIRSFSTTMTSISDVCVGGDI